MRNPSPIRSYAFMVSVIAHPRRNVAGAVHTAGTVPDWPIHRSNRRRQRKADRQSGAGLRRGHVLEALALAEKQKLCEPHLIDLACQLLACTRQSLGNASDQLRRPLEVIIVAMPGFSAPNSA
jgi:hypothetical protein